MSVLLAVLAAHSFLLCGLLAGRGRQVDRANLVLAALVGNVGLLLVEAWLGWSGTAYRQPHWIAVFRPAWFTIGPLALIYIRRCLGHGFRRAELLLALPALTVTLVMTPFYLLEGTDKLAHADHPGATGLLVIFLGFSFLTAGCTAWAARTPDVREACDEATPPWRAGWLRLLMAALSIYALVDAAATITFAWRGAFPSWAGVASLLMMTTLVYATGYLVIVPDGLLARVRQATARPRYARSELATSRAEHLSARLERLMATERPWLDDSLKLDDLAAQLRVSRHVLSQLLNQHLETTFHGYVNRRRIDEAKRLLRDPAWDGNMLAVGMAAGFGSQASFYRAFRKYVGRTPRAFVAGLSEPAARQHA